MTQLRKLPGFFVAFFLCVATLLHNPVLAMQSGNLAIPDIGDPSILALPPAEEKKLGKAFLNYLSKSNHLMYDSEIVDYIRGLGNRLSAQVTNPDLRFQFLVIDDPSINAFAGPSGIIGINTGLILAAESESELAGVMAHEIAHVSQRHLARALDLANRMRIPTAAALLAAILVGTQGGGEAAAGAVTSVTAASNQAQINFTRSNEEEADRVGIDLLHQSHFDPNGMSAFFEKLQSSHRFSGQQLPEFLRTHPVSVSRIADAQNRASQMESKLSTNTLEFELIRAKILGKNSTGAAIKRLEKALESGQYRNQLAVQYALGLALLETKQYRRAKVIFRKLLTSQPDQAHFMVALAKTLAAMKQREDAKEIYQSALRSYPGHRTLLLDFADFLLKGGEINKSKQLLSGSSLSHGQDPLGEHLLARIAQASGDSAEGHIHLAEFQYLKGQPGLAVQQLEIGMELSGLNYYQRERMASRLAELKTEMQEAEE